MTTTMDLPFQSSTKATTGKTKLLISQTCWNLITQKMMDGIDSITLYAVELIWLTPSNNKIKLILLNEQFNIPGNSWSVAPCWKILDAAAHLIVWLNETHHNINQCSQTLERLGNAQSWSLCFCQKPYCQSWRRKDSCIRKLSKSPV